MEINWFSDPPVVKVEWNDTTNLAGWHSKEEIEEHWDKHPERCDNVGYLIGEDTTLNHGALLIAARKGSFNHQEDGWGLIERIPLGVIRRVIYLDEGQVSQWNTESKS